MFSCELNSEQRQRHIRYLFSHLDTICAYECEDYYTKGHPLPKHLRLLVDHDPSHPKWETLINRYPAATSPPDDIFSLSWFLKHKITEARANALERANAEPVIHTLSPVDLASPTAKTRPGTYELAKSSALRLLRWNGGGTPDRPNPPQSQAAEGHGQLRASHSEV